jgi:hypothetical protein
LPWWVALSSKLIDSFLMPTKIWMLNLCPNLSIFSASVEKF